MAEDKNPFEDKYKNSSAEELVQAMAKLKVYVDETSRAKTDAIKEHDYLRMVAVPEIMDEQGISKLVVGDLGRVSLAGDLFVAIPATKREEAAAWIVQQGASNKIYPTINDSDLKKLVKGLMQKGEEIPEDLIKVTPYTRASITKIK